MRVRLGDENGVFEWRVQEDEIRNLEERVERRSAGFMLTEKATMRWDE